MLFNFMLDLSSICFLIYIYLHYQVDIVLWGFFPRSPNQMHLIFSHAENYAKSITNAMMNNSLCQNGFYRTYRFLRLLKIKLKRTCKCVKNLS